MWVQTSQRWQAQLHLAAVASIVLSPPPTPGHGRAAFTKARTPLRAEPCRASSCIQRQTRRAATATAAQARFIQVCGFVFYFSAVSRKKINK